MPWLCTYVPPIQARRLDAQIYSDYPQLNFSRFATLKHKFVFNISMFNETAAGPWEWDVLRLAASMAIAARDRGFPDHGSSAAAFESAAAHRGYMAELAGIKLLEAWYEQHHLEPHHQHGRPRMQKLTRMRAEKATEQTARAKEFAKLTVASGGPPLIYHDNIITALLTQEACGW